MWIAKVKMDGEKALIGGACKKYSVSACAYPVSICSKNKMLNVYFTLVAFGDENAKKKFFDCLKKSKRIINFEKNSDFVIGQIREKNNVGPMYKYNIVHVEPIKFDIDGGETWTVASSNKKDIIGFTERMERLFEAEILKITQNKITNISIMTFHPDLTILQKRAVQLAIEKEYYEHPRKIELKELAKLMNLSYSTYHAHLRKAERKLIPFLFEHSSRHISLES